MMRTIVFSVLFLCMFQIGCSRSMQIDSRVVDNMSREDAMNNLKKYTTKQGFTTGPCIYREDAVVTSENAQPRPFSEFKVESYGTVVNLLHQDLLLSTRLNTEDWCTVLVPPSASVGRGQAKLLIESLMVLGAEYDH